MKVEHRFTKLNEDAYDGIDFSTTSSEIRNPDGTVVFSQHDIQVPSSWSQVAADVIAQKYFRKAGVPARLNMIFKSQVVGLKWQRTLSHRNILEKLEFLQD